MLKTRNERMPVESSGQKSAVLSHSGRDKLGDWDWHIFSTTYKIDN